MDALLLDLYDTLVWTDWPALSEPVARGLGVSAERLLNAYMQTRPARSRGEHADLAGDLGAIAEACGIRLAPEALRALARELVALGRRHVHLYDDALPLLRRVRARGTPVVLVSNCDHATRPIVEHLGLPDAFDAVVLSCEAGSAKPEAGIFLQALGRVSATPGRALFVDDQARYLDGAAALGMRTLRIARHPDAARAPGGAHAVIRSFAEIG